MADVFTEVDERVRAARVREAWAKGWPYAVALAAIALFVALGLWGWSEYVRAQQEKASIVYAGALDALQSDAAAAQRGFVQGGRAGPGAYRSLSLMQQAGLALKSGRSAEAIGLFEQAAKTAPDRTLADASSLKAAYIAMDTAALPELKARLEPLAASGRPYRSMAREALAFAELAAGQVAAARSDLTLLTLGSDVSDAARARARAALSMIQTGTAASLGQIVKAQSTLAPPLASVTSGPSSGPSAGPGSGSGQTGGAS